MWWYYLLGVVTAPLITPILKPAFRGVVRGVILLTDEAKKCAESVREDISDIAAEAKAEVHAQKVGLGGNTPTQ